MKKRRIKKRPIIILLIIIVALIIGINSIVKTVRYHNSYEYKLLQINYSEEEVVDITKLSDKTIDKILTLPYDRNIKKVINEKYFLEKNLFNYLDYLEESEYKLTDVIALINTGANNEWYSILKDTDTSKGNLMLVNKFYHLNNSYNSKDMKKISNEYSYGVNQMLTSETWNAFLNMWDAAKKEDLTLIINSSYRSFEEQNEVYNEYKESRGSEGADLIAARPGHSEHQTGMAIDIQTYGSTGKTFEEFDEFKWLQDNAHKYGFILRYPKDKEYLTGYSYESWHYRYVGVEVATYIHENNITYDEYYAYFIEGNKNE